MERNWVEFKRKRLVEALEGRIGKSTVEHALPALVDAGYLLHLGKGLYRLSQVVSQQGLEMAENSNEV
jgi:hypothetical protein